MAAKDDTHEVKPLAEVMAEGIGAPAGNQLDDAAPKPKTGDDRDEGGRFKPKGEDTGDKTRHVKGTVPAANGKVLGKPQTEDVSGGEADEDDETQADEFGRVPLSALKGERKRRQERDAEIATLKGSVEALTRNTQQLLRGFQEAARPRPAPVEKKPRPDFFENPEGFLEHVLNERLEPLQQRGDGGQVEAVSRMLAEDKYGGQAVGEAQAELERLKEENPRAAFAEWQRIMASPHPYGALVEWKRDRDERAGYGGDVKKFVQSEIAKFAKKHGIELEGDDDDAGEAAHGEAAHRQQPRNRRELNLPGQFAGARSAGNGRREDVLYSGAQPLSAIMKR